MEEHVLSLASHVERQSYWTGRLYELNVLFSSLRDDQWRQVLDVLWGVEPLIGPLSARYYPGVEIATAQCQVPPPTAAITQHGMLSINHLVAVGCNVLVTRSLFEGVSIQVPQGMFANLIPAEAPRVSPLETMFKDLALAIYHQVPFRLGCVGWDRECPLEAELQRDSSLVDSLFAVGGFFAAGDLLGALHVDPLTYPQAADDLRWVPFR